MTGTNVSAALRSFPARLALGFAIVALTTANASGQTQWRTYRTTDGLAEEWSPAISTGPSGRVFISHGDASTFNVYDGYTFTSQSSPGSGGVIREGPGGQLWSLHLKKRVLQWMENKSWREFSLDRAGVSATELLSQGAFAWGADRALIITSRRVLEFDRRTVSLNVLREQSAKGLPAVSAVEPWPSGDGGWAGGTGAVVRFKRGNRGELESTVVPFPAGGSSWKSVSVSTTGAEDVVVAVESGGLHRLLRWGAGGWKQITSGKVPLRGWKGSDDVIWWAELSYSNFRLFKTESGPNPVPTPPEAVFSGKLLAVLPMGDGSFFLGTSNGLAYHAAEVWRTPPELARFQEHASSLLETRSGEMYVIHGRQLLRRRSMRWSAHPLPPGFEGFLNRTQALAELPDGRLVLGEGPGLLSFNPSTEKFAVISRGPRMNLYVMGSSKNGGVWVTTTSDGIRYQLERYDGRRFEVVFDAGSIWRRTPPRTIVERKDGSILVVPSGQGFGEIRNGIYRHLSEVQGYRGEPPVTAAELSDGRLWFGCRDRILAYDGKQWSSVLEGTGSVRKIIETRDKKIWVASGAGVHRYDNASWLSNSQEEGIPPGTSFGILEDREGVVWITTTAGIARRHENADVEPPKVSVPPERNIGEFGPQATLRFEFQGTDRWRSSSADRLLFRFRLDGGQWSELSGQSVAKFATVTDGAHRLEVVAVDRNGNTSPTPAIWSFQVLRPWYREPAVILVALVGIAGLASGTHSLIRRVRGLRRTIEDRQTELATANIYLSQLTEATTAVMYVFRLEPDGRATCPYISPRIEELYSLTPDELREDAHPMFNAIPHPDRERLWRSIHESKRTLGPFREEFRQIHPTRGELWLEAFSTPVRDEDGSTIWRGFVNEITERKRVQRELQRRSAALENSLTPFAILSEKFHYLYANPSQARLWRYERHEDMVGLSWREHFADASVIETVIDEAKRNGSVQREITARRFDGATFELLLQVHRTIHEDGEVIWLATGMDITERKNGDRELQESRTRLEMAIDMGGLALWERDLNEDTFAPSEQFKRLFDFRGEKFTPRDIAAMAVPEDRHIVDRLRINLSTGSDSAGGVYRIRRKDGGTSWIESRARRLLHDREPRYIGISRDVTAEREAARSLELRKEFLETVLNYVPALVFTCRPDGSIEFVNNYGLRWMGIESNDPSDLFTESVFSDPKMANQWQEGLEGHEPFELEGLGRVRGESRWLWIQVVPQAAGEQGLVRWFGKVTDIDDRRNAEQASQQLNAELEHRVQSRTAQLAEVNKELESFAYSVSHDLRAPLRGIDGWSLALLEDYAPSLDNQAKEYLARVRNETRQMGQLIDDLLELSRLGRVKMVWTEIDLSAMAHEVIDRLVRREKGPEIAFEVEPGLRAHGDKSLLRIVLTNLLDNAMKFSGKRSDPRVHFGKRATERGDAFFVNDNGAGFDMQFANSLFRPFQRLHSAKAFPGTGAGLAIVHRMIRRHGGAVWAESAVNRGATFYFTLDSNERDIE